MQKLTAIIISFLRPGYTKACIRSLREQYPEINIIVGENGNYDSSLADVCNENNAKYVQLPFDSGVCVGRNELIKLVDTEFVLVGDDDFFYDKNALTDKMLAFIENNTEFDLIGGRVSVYGVVGNYQGYTKKEDRHFETKAVDLNGEFKVDEFSGLRYCPADLTFNYFIGRTEKIKNVPWDEKIKVAYEHFSWFFDFKENGGRVAFSPDPIVIHKPQHIKPEQSSEYMKYRLRQSDKDRFFEKYGIDYIVGMNGAVAYSPRYEEQRSSKLKTNETKFVDFCITTFKRPQALETLLMSIAKFYPMANVYIADQNEELDRKFYSNLKDIVQKAGLIKRISIDHLPYDCGVSFARNFLVNKTPSKYKLILDDDFIFTDRTDLKQMVDLLDQNKNIGIVGGAVEQDGYTLHFEFDLEINNGEIVQIDDRDIYRVTNGIRYKKTGCVLNFSLMRKTLFNYIQWDKDLKISEHTDFYLRMKKVPYNIAYCPDVVMGHQQPHYDSDYKALRQRDQFLTIMLNKHNATKIKYLNGQVVELMPDKSIKRYKEFKNEQGN